MKKSATGPFPFVTPYPTKPGARTPLPYQNRDVTSPKQFWTERLQRVFVGTQPISHVWGESDSDVRPVLNNIAAAAHACNLQRSRWVSQCFASTDDCQRFLTFLFEYKGHINSYWYYALIDIAGVEAEQASNAGLLATCLYQQAVQTNQIRAWA